MEERSNGFRHLRQANRHRPAEGLFGDCHRTCIAMLLGVERDTVPNFGVHYGDHPAWSAAVDAYLQPLGLSEFSVPFAGENEPPALWAMMESLNPGVPFIFAGRSRSGVNHSIVVRAGEAFDPHPDDAGIVGPCDDGLYWVTVYANWCRNGLSTASTDHPHQLGACGGCATDPPGVGSSAA